MCCIHSVTISPRVIALQVGEWYHEAEVTICPTNAVCNCVTWSSLNPRIASVNPTQGYIYGNSVGTTLVTVTAQDGSGCSDSCFVVVSEAIPVKSVTLNRTSVSIQTGRTYQLEAVLKPSSATNKNVIWSSSNPSVATVSGGVVSAKAPGTAVITAEAEGGSSCCVKSSCQIKVTNDVLVSSITLSSSYEIVDLCDSILYLQAGVCPSNANNKNIMWRSSDPCVVAVDMNSGRMTVTGTGIATIYATARDNGGAEASCRICCDRYTHELIHTFKFSETDAVLIRQLYDRIDAVFPEDSDMMKAWRCSRILGGFVYGNDFGDWDGDKDFIKWLDTAGLIWGPGYEEAKLTYVLGYTEHEYTRMKDAVKTQHNDITTPDFAHMQIALAARLAYKLSIDGIGSNIYLDAPDEIVSYFAGWLGDAVLVNEKTGTTAMADDDYCADLDAENISRYIARGHTFPVSINTYYASLTPTYTRADRFLSYISYATVKAEVFSRLIDKDEPDPMNQLKKRYPDTYNFLCSLADGLAHMAQY